MSSGELRGRMFGGWGGSAGGVLQSVELGLPSTKMHNAVMMLKYQLATFLNAQAYSNVVKTR